MELTRSTTDDRPGESVAASHYVLGGGEVGVSIARELRDRDRTVVLVDESADLPEVPTLRASPTDVGALAEAGVTDSSTVIVATRSDSRNLLIAQLVRAHFSVSRTVVVTNTSSRRDAFHAAGHDPVCVGTILADEIVERV
jgi:Trk K+ transport system NAD-binding subunit